MERGNGSVIDIGREQCGRTGHPVSDTEALLESDRGLRSISHIITMCPKVHTLIGSYVLTFHLIWHKLIHADDDSI